MFTHRRLFLAAAVLVAAAVWLPYWGFVMSAPQYPDESLVLNVSRLGITGDVQEVETLQQFIGVRFPKDVSELEWLVPAMLALAVVLAIGGVAGAGLAGRIIRWTSVGLRGVCIGKVGSRVPLPPLHHSRVLTESRTEWGGR